MADRFNPETDRNWNREPGIVVVEGSNYANEMAKFEQFPSRYGQAGNPYVKREFPKMVYRAQVWKGKIACGAQAADPNVFPNPNDFHREEELARRFTESCQMTVNDERELQRAMENGYREGPAEAVAYLEARQRDQGKAAAERNYQDRNMSEPAKAEAAVAVAEAFDRGEHLAAVPEQPIKRRRGRPRKNHEAA